MLVKQGKNTRLKLEQSLVQLIQGKKKQWNLNIKFTRGYVAIQTKKGYNICDFRETNGLVKIHLPALRDKSAEPKSELNWYWSESHSFWVTVVPASEIPSSNDMLDILEKSYISRE